ncbi:hypothetical protein [Chamaesiphon sp. VAR_69_metabat_338]|uniref:hypothetical protein n=1 Tax=Chamaesiphon sp. VAR_69_metabat_338 TaxID=2964704 RepID=UPI00286DA02A|nr:hypothetical protein [Chamaesiphon sp. VAR_69_metabat_338]
MKEIIIRLGEGTIQTGFNSVNVELKAAGMTQWEDRSNLPPNPELQQLLNEWQLLYPAAIELLSREINLSPVFDTETVTNVSSQDLVELNQNFQVLINNWLNRSDFGNIVGRLRTDLDVRDRILVIIVGDRLNIWQLPWHVWNLFASYPGAVEVFCKPRFTNVTQVKIQRSNEVKILSLCGRDPNLQLEPDFLKTLPQAAIDSLATTSAYELADRLTQSQPWQIFVFNGHGNTIRAATTNEPDLQAGIIYLDNDTPIEIDRLKQSLRVAVDRGLQIAIFNCCSGLGLAAQLSDIDLPYIIVMRELIPCSIARQFLADLLTEYSRGQSFPAAFQYARQRLILASGEFARFADWLPILFHNPLSRHVTWQDLTTPPISSAVPPQLVAICRYCDRPKYRLMTAVGASLVAAILALQLAAIPLISTLEQTIVDRTQIAASDRISPQPSVVKIINYEPFSSGNIINNDAELLKIVDRVDRVSQPTAWGISLKIDTTTTPHPLVFDRANIIPECIDRAIKYSCDRPVFVNSLLTKYLVSHSQHVAVDRQLNWDSASLSNKLFAHILTKIDRINSSKVLELSPTELKKQFDGKLILVGIFDEQEPTTSLLAKTAIEIDRLIRAHHPQHPLPLFAPSSPGVRFLWVFLWSLLAGLAVWRRQWWWLAIAICGQISIAGLLLIYGRGLPLAISEIAMMLVSTTIWAIKQIAIDPKLATVHNSLSPARKRN